MRKNKKGEAFINYPLLFLKKRCDTLSFAIIAEIECLSRGVGNE